MSDAESDETAENEGSKKSRAVYIIIAAVLIIALLTATIILVVYYVVLKPNPSNSVDKLILNNLLGKSGRNESDDQTELDLLAQNMEVITDKLLNFSEADDYCRSLSPAKRLFFPRMIAEEEALENKLEDLIPEETAGGTRSLFQEKCGNDFLLGLRKVLDKDWKTFDDDYVFGTIFFADMFLSHEDPSEQCLGIADEKENLLFRTLDCDDSDGWNCILCQAKCENSTTGFCYEIYIDRFRTDYDAASEFCEELVQPSSLATIKHKSVLKEIRNQIISKITDDCPIIGIGHQFAQNYESIEENPLSYETQQILYRPERKAYHNCIAVTMETEYKWEPIDCSERYCFVCN